MKRILLPCCVTGLLMLAAGALSAAPGPAEEQAKYAHLDIEVDESGSVRLTLTMQPEPANVTLLDLALGSALGCHLWQTEVKYDEDWSWRLHARCDDALRRRWLSHQAELNLLPLFKVLDRLGHDELWIAIHLPRGGFCDLPPENAIIDKGEMGRIHYSYRTSRHGSVPAQSWITFGYRPEAVLRFAPLTGVLLLPVGLTLWRRWRALRSPADRFAVWFGQWRFHQRLTAGTWCLWWLALCALDVTRLSHFARAGDMRARAFVSLMLFCLLPPVVALCLCKGLSAPVFAQVPEAGWTRRATWRQALWGLLAVLLFVGFGLAGLEKVGEGQTRWAGLSFLVAAVGGLVGLVFWSQARNTLPGPLPKGELRSRVFELAEKAAVRVKQVYLLPAARWRLVNAFAWPGVNVHLTAALPEHLSRREVDALTAQELTFLWRHRVRNLAFPIVVIGLEALVGAALGWLAVRGTIDFERWWFVLVLPSFCCLPLLHFRLRRFGPSLDASAVALTGDPEALITALKKLERHDLLPLYAGPRQATPAALTRRLEAIAEREDIPPDRLREILEGPGTGTECYDTLPAPAEDRKAADTATDKLFSPAFRKRLSRRLTWMIVAAVVLPPAVAGYLAGPGHEAGIPRWAVYLGGLGATLALYPVVVGRGAVRGAGWIRQELEKKLEGEGVPVRQAGGVFVGLAPGPSPRVYESNYDWDLGFLFFAEDYLCYVGEGARFTLSREQITAVTLGPGPPRWWRSHRLYVTWRDTVREAGGTFSLRPAAVRSLAQIEPQVKRLYDRVQAWWGQPPVPESLPVAWGSRTTPEFGAATGTSPKAVATPQVFIANLILLLPIALAVALVFGLSFDVQEGGAGWYVLAVVTLMVAVQLAPYWRYRDPEAEHMDPDD